MAVGTADNLRRRGTARYMALAPALGPRGVLACMWEKT